MRVRDTRIGRLLFLLVAGWSLWFAFDVARIGDVVTSKQWQYLMGVPLGKWMWAILFGIPGAVTIAAVLKRRHRVAAAGLFLIGWAALLITGFYLLAPLINPGLLTLGYNPWAFAAVAAFICAGASWTGMRWR